MNDDKGKCRYERILSLDGGGTWALIQVRTLMDLFGETRTGVEVLEHFDLVVANSGGSIVAAALAADMPLARIASLFEDERIRSAIFSKKSFQGLRRRFSFPRYTTSAKYEALKVQLEPLQNTTLAAWRAADTKRLPHVMIIGFDYDTERAAFFRSDLHSRSSGGASQSATFLDAVHASTNAPVQFFDAPTEVHTPGGRRRYWDGAIAGHNNPTLAGVVEAVANGAAREKIKVLSLGTGTVRLPRPPVQEQEKSGFFNNLKKLAESIVNDPPDAASYSAHVLLDGGMPSDGASVGDGPVVRMNPMIRAELEHGKRCWHGSLPDETWEKLSTLDMDAVAEEDAGLIRELCDAWLHRGAPNQPIRMNDKCKAEIGHDTYAEAKERALEYFEQLRPTGVRVSVPEEASEEQLADSVAGAATVRERDRTIAEDSGPAR